MAVRYIPNTSIEDMNSSIDASLPGDELIFEAGFYTFDRTVILKHDRRYIIRNQYIYVTDNFQGEYLFEIEENAQYVIVYCVIDTRGKCKGINFQGSNPASHAGGLFWRSPIKI